MYILKENERDSGGTVYQAFIYNGGYYVCETKSTNGELITFFPITKNDIIRNYRNVVVDEIPIWN